MQTRHYIWVIFALLTIVGFKSANSEEIRTPVLQVKQGEVCLGAGTEDLVFAGCRYVIMRKKDTVDVGSIHTSFRTISIGESQLDIANRDTDKYFALVQTASIDSGASVTLRTSLAQPELVMAPSFAPVQPNVITREFADAATPLVFRPVDSSCLIGAVTAYAPDTSLSLRNADLVVSLVADRWQRDEIVAQQPAPFVVALIPNLSSNFNQRGELATSVYQRLDPSRSSLFAPGMIIHEVSSFLGEPGPGSGVAYDPEQARRIFRSISPRPREVVLLQTEPVLQPLAAYLADLLARDQCRVRIESNPTHWDIAICLLPANGDPTAAIKAVLRQLARDTSAAGCADIVRSLSGQLGTMNAATDNADSENANLEVVRTIDRTLRDYGCFPLFRPEFVVVARATLRKIRLTGSRLDFNEAFKVLLPATSEQVAP